MASLYQEPGGMWTANIGSDVQDMIKEGIVLAQDIGPLVLFCNTIHIRVDALTDSDLAYQGYRDASGKSRIGPFHPGSGKPRAEDPFLDVLEI